VTTLFRRKSVDAAPEAAAEEPAVTRPRGYTPSKKELGKVTPKRKSAGRAVQPPPANQREAAKRMRDKERAARAEARAGMLAGKEEFLLVKDKGPDRALIRDIVDARRNVASFFLPGAFIVVIGASNGMPPQIRLAANLLWLFLAVGLVVDSFLLCRRVKRLVSQRFPGDKPQYYWAKAYRYTVGRSLNLRRMRVPNARVKVGDSV
jgi:hypothetical protein